MTAAPSLGPRRFSPRRGLTLIEVTLSAALLLILGAVVASSMLGTTDTIDIASAITESQLEAERVARRIRQELRRSGVLTPGDLRISTNPLTLKDDIVDFTALSSEEPLFDPADPWRVPYEDLPQRIAFEPEGGGGGLGGGVVDGGRVSLYRGGQRVAILGRGVSALEFELQPGEGASGLPALKITVRVDRLNRAAIKGSGDLQGAIRSHTSTSMVTLLN